MPSVADIRKVVEQQPSTHMTKDILSCHVLLVLLGESACASEQRMTREYVARWENAASNAIVLSVRQGNGPVSATIDEKPGCKTGRLSITYGTEHEEVCRQLSNFLAQVIYRSVRREAVYAPKIAIVADPIDPLSRYAGPIALILNDLLFDKGGSVTERDLFVSLGSVGPEYAKELGVFKGYLQTWGAGKACEPVRAIYDAQSPGEYRFIVPGKSLALAESTFSHIFFLGDRNSMSETISLERQIEIVVDFIDPKSGIVWPSETPYCSGFVYPDSAERGLDVALAWEIVNERLRRERQAPVDDAAIRERFQRACSSLFAALLKAAGDVANAMMGWAVSNTRAVHAFEASLRTEKRPADERLERTIFGNALRNKQAFLWMGQTSTGPVHDALEQWRSEVGSIVDGVWNEGWLKEDALSKLAVSDEMLSAQKVPLSASITTGYVSQLAEGEQLKIEKLVGTIVASRYGQFSEGAIEQIKEMQLACNEWTRAKVTQRVRLLRQLGQTTLMWTSSEIANAKELFCSEPEVKHCKGIDSILKSRSARIGEILDANPRAYEEYKRIVNQGLTGYHTGLHAYMEDLAKLVMPLDPMKLGDGTGVGELVACLCTFVDKTSKPLGVIRGGKNEGKRYFVRALPIDMVANFSYCVEPSLSERQLGATERDAFAETGFVVHGAVAYPTGTVGAESLEVPSGRMGGIERDCLSGEDTVAGDQGFFSGLVFNQTPDSILDDFLSGMPTASATGPAEEVPAEKEP